MDPAMPLDVTLGRQHMRRWTAYIALVCSVGCVTANHDLEVDVAIFPGETCIESPILFMNGPEAEDLSGWCAYRMYSCDDGFGSKPFTEMENLYCPGTQSIDWAGAQPQAASALMTQEVEISPELSDVEGAHVEEVLTLNLLTGSATSLGVHLTQASDPQVPTRKVRYGMTNGTDTAWELEVWTGEDWTTEVIAPLASSELTGDLVPQHHSKELVGRLSSGEWLVLPEQGTLGSLLAVDPESGSSRELAPPQADEIWLPQISVQQDQVLFAWRSITGELGVTVVGAQTISHMADVPPDMLETPFLGWLATGEVVVHDAGRYRIWSGEDGAPPVDAAFVDFGWIPSGRTIPDQLMFQMTAFIEIPDSPDGSGERVSVLDETGRLATCGRLFAKVEGVEWLQTNGGLGLLTGATMDGVERVFRCTPDVGTVELLADLNGRARLFSATQRR